MARLVENGFAAYWQRTLAGLLVLVAAACTTSSGPPAGGVSKDDTATPLKVAKLPPGVADPMDDTQQDYRIGALNVLDISVFGVPDLTKTVRVSGSGQIAFPLIGSVRASGKTPLELKAELESKLGAKYLQSPQVDVSVKESTSQRVTIEGAVKESGVYPLVGETTLLQSIAMAKGLGETADSHGILIFRKINGKKNVARFDLAAIKKGQATDPVLQAGDVIVVDESGLKAAWAGLKNSLGVATMFVPFL